MGMRELDTHLGNLVLLTHARLPLGTRAALVGANVDEEQWVLGNPVADKVAQVVAVAQVLECLGRVLDRELGDVGTREHVLKDAGVEVCCCQLYIRRG